jgi:outer membrane immunogenic protein
VRSNIPLPVRISIEAPLYAIFAANREMLMSRLLTSLLIGVAVITFAQIASAADLSRKAPAYTPPPPPPVSWTGFYAGINIGYSWGDASTDITGSGTATTFDVSAPGFLGFPSSFAFADSNTARLHGVIGGGQIGYNYQLVPNWVLGIEADIQAASENGSSTFVDGFSTPVCTSLHVTNGNTFSCNNYGLLNGTAETTYHADINWFGTVRGRVGYLITPQVLLYGTGGLAYGRVSVSGFTNFTGVVQEFPVGTLALGSGPFSLSKNNVGFSVGGGIEGSVLLPANWTWKLEYLYLDLGSMDTVTSFSGRPIQFLSAVETITTHTHFTDNIVRFA